MLLIGGIILLFGLVISLDYVSGSYFDIPGVNLTAIVSGYDTNETFGDAPKGIPALPQSSTSNGLEVVSLKRAISTLTSDPITQTLPGESQNWQLVHAVSESVGSDGLAYKWYLVMKSNNSILTGAVQGGKAEQQYVQETVSVPVNASGMSQLWDTPWIMYEIMDDSITRSRYSGVNFAVEYNYDVAGGVFKVKFTDPDPDKCLNLNFNGYTGERIAEAGP